MNTMLSVLLLAAVAATPAEVPEVRALLVTHVRFADKDREKIAATAIELLASSSSSCPAKAEDFEGAFRQCHLYVKPAKPQEIIVNRRQKVTVEELIISFPTNTGAILVRSGKEHIHFTKFGYESAKKLQELFKTASPQ